MYIEPNSTLYILKNCPLDTTYDHTLYFNKDNPDIGKLNQSNYFASLAKYKLSSETGEPLSYVRTARGAVKVPFKADDLYDCNYIMYRNIGFGNKWFYAFIKSVDYINTVTSQINFEIDVMQTWMFDYEIDMCFVEREHSYTDVPGQNTLPENVDLGDYFSTGNFGTGVLKDWRIVVVRTAKTETAGYTTVTGAFYNGTYQQVEFDTWEPNETALDKIKGLLDALSVFNHQDTVIGIYLMPAALIPPKRTNLADSFADGRRTTEQGVQICTRPETLARGYIPKNKKLLTYPYCYLSCTNFEGSEKVYKYEYFRDKTGVNIQQQIRFVVYSDIGVRPTIMIAPINYMAYWEGEEYQPNPEEGITLSNIPQASWATSDAGAKFFQALTSIAMLGTGATIPETATKVETTQTRNPATGRLNITSRTTVSRPEQEVPGVTGKDIAKELATGAMSTGVNSVTGVGNIMQSVLGGIDFGFRQLSIRPEYAKVIDDYFNCFGYATKQVKKPNTHSRPHWNYVKTLGCTVTGSVPCDDMNAICHIYDRGITFWRHGHEVGDYSLDNSPS